MNIKDSENLEEIVNKLNFIANRMPPVKIKTRGWLHVLVDSWMSKIKNYKKNKAKTKEEKRKFNVWLNISSHEPTASSMSKNLSNPCVGIGYCPDTCIVKLYLVRFHSDKNQWLEYNTGNVIEVRLHSFFEFK